MSGEIDRIDKGVGYVLREGLSLRNYFFNDTP